MAEYYDISSISIGRHSDVEDESLCTHAVKKEVLIRGDTTDVMLYVRVECDECGVIRSGEYMPTAAWDGLIGGVDSE